MSKTFKTAPNPKHLSPDQIEAFEKSGPGHDTGPANPLLREAANELQSEADLETKTPKPTKRFCIDLPESTHRRFKTACSANGVTMLNEITEFVERRTTELESAFEGNR